MIKIPSSYKIIKNCNISKDENELSHIDTIIDYSAQQRFISLYSHEEEDNTTIVEDIRSEISKEMSVEMELEKQKIIEIAREEAEGLKLRSQEQGYEEGYEEGYTQGYKKGMQDAEVEGVIIKNNAINVLEQAKRNVSEYFIENRANIIKLAGDMAEGIVHSTIDTTTENIVMLIKPILQQYGKKENIIITSHPNNSAYIKGNLHQMEELCPDVKFIILEDNNLEKNGCIIENEHQIIDLQIKKQINAIVDEIKNLE